ncbi:MAG TPA: hypothetical protein DCS93_09050 [Microscillaceae bacterium]|nr:hypothetical protein [Microscillaceae bacterium]
MKKVTRYTSNVSAQQVFLNQVQGKTYQIEKQLSDGQWVSYGQLIFQANEVIFNAEELSSISYNARTQMLHMDFGWVSYEGSCCLHFFNQQQVFSGNYQKTGEGITQIRGKVC